MLKLTLKLTLIISLFTVTAFAEGQQTNGGKNDGSSGGGLVCAECVTNQTDTKDNYDDSLMEFIREFFNKIIG